MEQQTYTIREMSERFGLPASTLRYYDQDTWKENLIFEKDSFELLQDILEDAGELTDRTAYENLVQTEYAQKACEN